MNDQASRRAADAPRRGSAGRGSAGRDSAGRGGLVGWAVAFVAEPLREAAELQRAHAGRPDLRPAIVLTSAALLLTIREYFFQSQDLRWVLDALGAYWPGLREWAQRHWRYSSLCWWIVGQNTTYVLAPVLIVKLVFRERLVDYGVKLKGMFSGWWLYAGMFAVMAPLISMLSRTESFRHTYPFYRPPDGEPFWPLLGCWELMYASQFVALEFFFRGYLVHGTKRQFGAYSVFVMMVPYCMIHYGKPLPETIGAIIAGIVLGFMSLKTRSIWLGAALHIAVAWSMDFAALR